MCGREEEGAGVPAPGQLELLDTPACRLCGWAGETTGQTCPDCGAWLDGADMESETPMIDINNDFFCIYCGLPQTLEPGISGCSGETSTDHNFVDPTKKPFGDWDTLRLRRRVNRAIVKARSSRAMVLHVKACPAPAWGVDMLYSEKFVKRTNLAAHGTIELIHRGVISLMHPEAIDAETICVLMMEQIDNSLGDKEAPLVNLTSIKEGLAN